MGVSIPTSFGARGTASTHCTEEGGGGVGGLDADDGGLAGCCDHSSLVVAAMCRGWN